MATESPLQVLERHSQIVPSSFRWQSRPESSCDLLATCFTSRLEKKIGEEGRDAVTSEVGRNNAPGSNLNRSKEQHVGALDVFDL